MTAIPGSHPRKIVFVITSFIHYARSFFILEELKNRKDVELHVVVGSGALHARSLSRLANVKELLTHDNFPHVHEVYFNLDGDASIAKAKTAGLGIVEFSSVFFQLRPDMVVVRGDRFEVLAAAVAAAYLHIPIAHLEGGDVTGTLDESVRHAITKLSHIHFVTHGAARARILRMGEDPQYVFSLGSPEIEVAHRFASNHLPPDMIAKTGSGASVDVTKDFLMVMYHPASTVLAENAAYTRELLAAVHGMGMPAVWFWPNLDAGAEEIAHEIRIFHDRTPNHRVKFLRYLPPQMFLPLLKRARCLVGNSSAGIKECSYLGVPVVNVGSRQTGRLRAENVVDAECRAGTIQHAIAQQLAHGPYSRSSLYTGDGVSAAIANVMATTPLYVQKKFHD